ncbi:MAG: diaminopimelate decarboxylase [Gammaproteobacteria bacterium]|nr:diaminopimelate decarboxylase [Gammaproteobacteria bacterium]
MNPFNYQGRTLYAEEVAVPYLSSTYGTPCFIYSRTALEHHYQIYQQALHSTPHLICYAVKANSNLAVLNVLARLGSGFDIVSGGELQRVLAAGGEPHKVIFSGLGKTVVEIEAALEAGILCFNVESTAELERVDQIARTHGLRAPVSMRVNPDVDAGTHPYISTGLKENKFGIASDEALDAYTKAAEMPGIELIGIDCHIGSQLTSIDPFLDAIDRLLIMVDELAGRGILLRHLDMGGGLGVIYGHERPPLPSDLMVAASKRLGERNLTLLIEPGRSIAANAGIFVTRVEYLKCTQHKNFAIVDGAMNDLLRPALYNAWHDITTVKCKRGEPRLYDVVGPVCVSADFLGKQRQLVLSAGDLLAVRSAGAYGFVMSSNYNSRGRAAEIMVDGSSHQLVRQREDISVQMAAETCLPS